MRIGSLVRRVVPVTAVAVATAVVAAYAVAAVGNSVQRPDLNNSGIWTSSDRDQMVGRFNKSASVIDAGFGPFRDAPPQLDVLQEGNRVVAVDGAQNPTQLVAVDSALAAANVEQPMPLPAKSAVDMRGGTLAVLDESTGKLWAIRTEKTNGYQDLTPLDPNAKPLAELPDPTVAAMSVSSDGSIDVVGVNGATMRVPAAGMGFGAPVTGTVPALKSVQVAALGDQFAAFDPQTGALHLSGGATVQVPGADVSARIQAGGNNLGYVIVATRTSLVQVDLGGGAPVEIDKGHNGAPARPIVFNGYAYGAWAGEIGQVGIARAGEDPKNPQIDNNPKHAEDGQRLTDPVFRVNWGQVVLNDRSSGRIFDLNLQLSLDDWSAAKDSNKDVPKSKEPSTQKSTDAPPEATDDQYWVRPGRTSVMHVLDNDSDPNGKVLAITALTPVSPVSAGSAVISPDGQAILYTPAGNEVVEATLKYTIKNLARKTASATVHIIPENSLQQNHDPKPRPHNKLETPQAYVVAVGGEIQLPVAADYRDEDCDPITLTEVTVPQGMGTATITSDNLLDYQAPASIGKADVQVKINYKVSDGVDPSGTNAFTQVDGQPVVVTVIDPNDPKKANGAPPIANPDVAHGEVGKPVTIMPLANDVPGVDPANPQTRLTLAADVPVNDRNLKVTTDRVGGRVTVVASAPGAYALSYVAGFGSAGSDKRGTIRVDIDPASDAKAKPVTVPVNAVVHAQAPAMVDALASASDPRGGLLVVQTATPGDDKDLGVGVVQGRWVRIVPLREHLATNPATVTFTVTNGDAEPVTGTINVTQLAALPQDVPLLRDDFADVRAGDSVLVPVLANDTSAGGAQLTLDTNDTGASNAGALQVVDPSAKEGENPDVGSAWVSGTSVRYAAPASVAVEKQVEITYYAKAGDSTSAHAKLTVTVHPAPSADNPDSPPVPKTIEARVVSGDTTTIHIPTSGQDPDGDSVLLVGLGSIDGLDGPRLGRIVSYSPNAIVYQAYPNAESTGTDEFGYTLADQYGQQGVGIVRVAVVPPGQTQPPMAVDDIFTAGPGKKVDVDVLANDFVTPGDPVLVTNVDSPGKLLDKQGPVELIAPAPDTAAVVVGYQLTGNGGAGPSANITLTGQEGFVNPPKVVDQIATPGEEKMANADVSKGAWDPSFDVSQLKVTVLGDAAPAGTKSPVVVSGTKVSMPMTDAPQILTYRAENPDGGQAAALIFVPALGQGPPYVDTTVVPIKMDANSTKTIQLADYVKSPRAQQVRLTTEDKVSASPVHLDAVAASLTSVTLTSKDDYAGPAALNLEVTDRSSLTATDGQNATVSIPVQIGPPTPVLWCPDSVQRVQAGGDAVSVDVTSLCHVWTPDPGGAAKLTYATGWVSGQQADGVTAKMSDDQRAVVLTAALDARPQTQGTLQVSVNGAPQVKPGEIHVIVLPAPLPKLEPITAEVPAGKAATGPLHLTGTLRGAKPTIVSIDPQPGTPAGDAAVTGSGTNVWSVTPRADLQGARTLRYTLTASDVADGSRQVHTTLTVRVYTKPGAPGAPQQGTPQSHSAVLSWAAPDNGGAPITKYELALTAGGSTKWTSPATTFTATGLKNAVHYRFHVRAVNKAGPGGWSLESVDITPNQAPNVISGFVASNPDDGKITLTWDPVTVKGCDCSIAGLQYIIVFNGQTQTVDGSRTTFTPSGLPNDQITFSIWAETNQDNIKLRSKQAATTTGWPSGPPGAFTVDLPATPKVTDHQVAVTLNWSAAAANGEPPVRYSVTDNGTPIASCQDITGTSCVTDKIAGGSGAHTFQVVATNKPAKYKTAEKVVWQAEWTPTPMSTPKAVPTGNNQEIEVSGTAGYSNGPAGATYVKVMINGASVGTISVSNNGGTYNGTYKSPKANGTHVSVTTQLCYKSANNGAEKCGSESGGANVTPFGPLGNITLNVSASNNVLNVDVSADPNGAPATLSLTHDGSEKQCKQSQTGSTQTSVSFSCSVTIKWADSRNFTATFTSSATSPSRAGQTKTKTATGKTPAPPAMTITSTSAADVGGGVLRVHVVADVGGVSGKLSVTGSCSASDSGTGSLTADCDANVGYSSTGSFKATVSNTDSMATRADVTKSFSGSTGAAPAPTVTISQGAKVTATDAQGRPFTGRILLVTTRNFSGSYTCTYHDSYDNATFGSITVNGDVTDYWDVGRGRPVAAYYGYQLWAVCGGVTSPRITSQAP